MKIMWHEKIMGSTGDIRKIIKHNCQYTYKILQDGSAQFFYNEVPINSCSAKVYKGQKIWFKPNKLESEYGMDR